MKKGILLTVNIILAAASFAQKQRFELVSYTMPKGWLQQRNEGGLQLSITNKRTGDYAIAVITKATASASSDAENFINDWNRLVKSTVQVNDEPEMQDPTSNSGWNIISGSAKYTDKNNTGSATLLTATGGGQTLSVVLMTNTKQYQNDLLALLNSLELAKAVRNEPGNAAPVTSNESGKPPTAAATASSNDLATMAPVNSALTGRIWEGTSSEKFTGAGAMTGHYTGGFHTVQYKFNSDSTYRFVEVLASFYTTTKTLKYETGTWSVDGDQLTIKPTKGQNEEWSKVGKTSNGNSDVVNRAVNDTWGRKIKASTRKLEKYTYSFSISKNGDKNALVLQRNGPTEREGEGKISYYNETLPARSATLPSGLK